ncbi:hypothetical protein [Streptomyces cavernae]|uniref:hypothetical protein n=1 Tax=Streptomyces cavernae TaxID=2259034 RepID=UPI000FEB966C|nr:hypothetical protein [Streptomyces cavernae]
MRTRMRVMAVAAGAVTLAVALTSCNDSEPVNNQGGSESRSADSKTVYRLGEASPPQESTMQKSKGATFTVTPTKVQTGTKAEVEKSGLQLDKSDGPQVPVYVWATLTHNSGKAMTVGDMDDDLVVATDKGQRTKALIVLMGQAKWPNCPAADTEKPLSGRQSEKICNVFLVPEGQKASAVELTQGYYNDPLKWPVMS